MNTSLPASELKESGAAHEPGQCRYCLSTGMRRSRFRSGDVARLLLLQWPMRCMECRKRQYGSFSEARKAVPAALAHGGALQSKETWEQYTADSRPSRVRYRVRVERRKRRGDKDAA